MIVVVGVEAQTGRPGDVAYGAAVAVVDEGYESIAVDVLDVDEVVYAVGGEYGEDVRLFDDEFFAGLGVFEIPIEQISELDIVVAVAEQRGEGELVGYENHTDDGGEGDIGQ